jgi:hypothetical protein
MFAANSCSPPERARDKRNEHHGQCSSLHKCPDARDDDPATIRGDTKTYIRDFDRSLSESHSPQELVDEMMVLHGGLGNPYTLWTAAQGVFDQGQGASSSAVS